MAVVDISRCRPICSLYMLLERPWVSIMLRLDMANPVAQILSGALMLRYSFNEDAAARSIEHAVASALADGCLTGDLIGGRTDVKALSTSEMGDEIVKRIH